MSLEHPWWRDAVIYQVYVRSFADATGDGVGDLAGIESRVPYLSDLGVDAIWLTPFYPSPQVDQGYDVADYFEVDPTYGTLADFDSLLAAAHSAEIKMIIDIVPNHSSDQHEWFQEALKSLPGSIERARYHFRDGKGEVGELPPNDWQSIFGGPAWTRVIEQDGEFGQWYLHIFAPEQPDFNWDNPEVRSYFEDVLRFWLDRGVDGFRIDVAHGLVKDPTLPDIGDAKTEMLEYVDSPMWDQEGVHEIYRSWHKILAEYPGDRMAVAEAWIAPASRMARYVRSDELSQSFNFDFLCSQWDAQSLKQVIDESITAVREVGAPPSWVFNNHDVVRSVDRFALGLTAGRGGTTLIRQGDSQKLDLELGRRRARAGALLMLALPGGAYLYQGEELALPEVRDIPTSSLQDPSWRQSGFVDVGRDGCRIPLPWHESASGAFGFSENLSLLPREGWLPQPEWWGRYAAEDQEADADSALNMYRRALAIRHSHSGLGNGEMSWLPSQEQVLLFERGDGFLCLINFAGIEVQLPDQTKVIISSVPITGNLVPSDTAVWLQRG
ncbi:MAG TPA: glycoside hydrolase family 13 protein [Candidatus Nanopelagicaceae bacterium]|nr:glycoside hydrolase family 13 protein [Candidatus Nanopelagicaceae bacterium]